ncbi:MAG: hypothetical protein ABIJ92_04395 [Candidatus Aenigmatarchaeota archaeon]
MHSLQEVKEHIKTTMCKAVQVNRWMMWIALVVICIVAIELFVWLPSLPEEAQDVLSPFIEGGNRNAGTLLLHFFCFMGALVSIFFKIFGPITRSYDNTLFWELHLGGTKRIGFRLGDWPTGVFIEAADVLSDLPANVRKRIPCTQYAVSRIKSVTEFDDSGRAIVPRDESVSSVRFATVDDGRPGTLDLDRVFSWAHKYIRGYYICLAFTCLFLAWPVITGYSIASFMHDLPVQIHDIAVDPSQNSTKVIVSSDRNVRYDSRIEVADDCVCSRFILNIYPAKCDFLEEIFASDYVMRGYYGARTNTGQLSEATGWNGVRQINIRQVGDTIKIVLGLKDMVEYAMSRSSEHGTKDLVVGLDTPVESKQTSGEYWTANKFADQYEVPDNNARRESSCGEWKSFVRFVSADSNNVYFSARYGGVYRVDMNGWIDTIVPNNEVDYYHTPVSSGNKLAGIHDGNDLCIVDMDTRKVKNVTHGQIWDVDWVSDTGLVFWRDLDGVCYYSLSADSSWSLNKKAKFPSVCGDKIFYLTHLRTHRDEWDSTLIWEMSLDGSSRTVARLKGGYSHLSMSSDCSIAVLKEPYSSDRTWVNRIKTFSFNDCIMTTLTECGESPRITTDNRIVYVKLYPVEGRGDFNSNSEVRIMDLDGRNDTLIVNREELRKFPM